MAETLHTIKDAAPLLGVGTVTAWRMVKSETIRAIDIRRPGTKRPAWRIPQSAIDDLGKRADNQIGVT